ncbi:MAG TPA: sigma-70 family RNA polymerase sigma factor [Kofleriaceae bacterium]|nr:sigma-70 family RNA polymerase sigma factor [Kofleriaceae bacterium]
MAVTPDVVLRELAGLRALAQSLVHGDADAEDLLQETAIAAITHPPTVEADGSPRPWLAKVLRNRWRMDRRARARRIAREQTSELELAATRGDASDVAGTATTQHEAVDAVDAIDRARVLEKLAGALVALEEPFRTTIVRRYLDGDSAADIARALGVPAGTVRWRLKTGLERLRASLDEKSPRWQRALAPFTAFKGAPAIASKASSTSTATTTSSLLKGAVLVKAKTTIVSVIAVLLLLGGGGFAIYKLRGDGPSTSSPSIATSKAPGTGSAAGSGKIIVEAAGSGETGSAAPEPVPGQGRVVVSTVAAEGGVISGRVVNWSTGEGVMDAEITFTSTAGATTIKSGKGGAFELAPPKPGTFALATILAPGFLPYAPELEHSPVRVALASKQAVRGLTLFLQPALDYYGLVVDGSGAPVAGARVKLADPPSGEQSLEKVVNEWTTDKQGQFVFHAQDETVFEATKGNLRGWAVLDGNAQTTHKLTIKIGNAPARDATIRGKVVDGSGAPVPDVLVTAVPEDSPATAQRDAPRSVMFATSGNDGAFVLEGLDRKTYTLIGEDEDHAQARLDKIAGGTQNVTITLDAGLPLAGTVRNADDQPVPAYTLLVTRREGLVREIVTTRSVIDPRGKFDVRVPKGSYELIASADGWATSTPLAVAAGTTDATLKLSAGATLVGVVVDGATGKPLEYARVWREGATGGATASPANAGVVTRADGTFELAGIPPGPFTISVGAGNYNPKLESGLVARDGATVGPLRVELRKLNPGEEPKMELVGIGVKLSADGEALKVDMVAPEGGAAGAGIVAGDLLVAVDGVPVTQLGIDGAVARIRGVAGTKLSIGVKRGEQVSTLVVERKPVKL